MGLSNEQVLLTTGLHGATLQMRKGGWLPDLYDEAPRLEPVGCN
jgi:hypothetical protein